MYMCVNKRTFILDSMSIDAHTEVFVPRSWNSLFGNIALNQFCVAWCPCALANAFIPALNSNGSIGRVLSRYLEWTLFILHLLYPMNVCMTMRF